MISLEEFRALPFNWEMFTPIGSVIIGDVFHALYEDVPEDIYEAVNQTVDQNVYRDVNEAVEYAVALDFDQGLREGLGR